MQRDRMERMLGELRGMTSSRCTVAGDAPRDAPTFTVDANRYRDRAWLDRELATVFRAPRAVVASSQIDRGGCLPIDVPGVSALLARDGEGRLRAFANACRHRGTRLVDAPCAAKAFVCPYHGWTYGLDGALMHVPHAEAFGGAPQRDLVPRPIAERHGLVWLGDGADTHARELDDDLAALALDEHVLYRRGRSTHRCNWKLVLEAFLDNYHIRVLHRDSIYRFFLDATSIAEPVGRHVRALTARRALREPGDNPRMLASPSFMVFPATTIVVHPDFVSLLTVHPLAPNVTDWDHLMLIPRTRAGETEHWEKSWKLIEETVFQREDLWVCEQIQRTIDAGDTDELLFGALEEPVRWFHATLEGALR